MKERQLGLPVREKPARRKLQWQDQAYSHGFRCVAGLDEVGRGPLAGPVVAAAVILSPGTTHPDIQDSKLVPSKKREELAAWIKENALAWGLGIAGSEEIDRINILKASLLAMARAFKELDPLPDCLLIDGQHEIPLQFLGEADRQLTLDGREEEETIDVACVSGIASHAFPQQRTITKGDRLCLSIAAASIVAKVARDQMMLEYDRLYPEYGFNQHKGYGSPGHLAALRRHGPSPIHRRSFGPVGACLAVPTGNDSE